MTNIGEAVIAKPPVPDNKGLRDVAGSTVARAMVMPVSALAVLWSSSLVTQQKGVEGFALFSIFVALPYMVPVSDFGISVSVTDTLAKKGLNSPEFRFVWRRTLLLLTGISILTVAVSCYLALHQKWAIVLGLPPNSDTEIAGLAMMAIMAAGIPLGAGQRVLLGQNRQTLSTLLTSSSGIVSLAAVWVALTLPSTGYTQLAVAYGLGPLLMQVVIFIVAARSLRAATRPNVPSGPPVERVKILRVAAPMALLTIALPLTYQSDRVLLSHFSDILEVAKYSFVSMYYVPLLSIVTVGSQALWPMFMKTVSTPRRLDRQFRKADKLFAGLGLLMMVGLVAVGPAMTAIVSAGKGNAPLDLYVVFGVMLLLFGLNATPGMLLMDHKGRIIQAAGAVIMLICKIPLSILLIPLMGATGAVIATLIPMTLCMIIPTRVFALIRLKKGS